VAHRSGRRRLTLLRGSGAIALGDVVDPLVTELDAARQRKGCAATPAAAPGAPADARRGLVARCGPADASVLAALGGEADSGPRSATGCQRRRLRPPRHVDRLIRDRYALPTIAID
jgi:hypothetical protein